ncbi:hypothetical protein [Evansella tamaricis]|uniref:Uncharacterized protein n=1 Tax=Evansella tamaricis TaxID=2069301 RepID=A0ABS6JBM9_9BACI|nr:hypothetical protein [Evansella tamaricis]MBU9711079.1 hypothetical protein [Evansella tamaricis]
MLIAYKIFLLSIIIITFIGTVGERKDENLRNNMTAICIASMISFLIAVLLL